MPCHRVAREETSRLRVARETPTTPICRGRAGNPVTARSGPAETGNPKTATRVARSGLSISCFSASGFRLNSLGCSILAANWGASGAWLHITRAGSASMVPLPCARLRDNLWALVVYRESFDEAPIYLVWNPLFLRCDIFRAQRVFGWNACDGGGVWSDGRAHTERAEL